MRPQDIELPNYTRKQEWWNCFSHILGAVFGLIGGAFLIYKGVLTGDPWHIASYTVFAICMVALYTFSALYHGMRPGTAKKVLRVMDHDMVFVLIMGTYTPYCLVSLRESSPAWAWSILGICYALGVLGIALNSSNIKKFAVFSMIDYICMGWLIIISIYPLTVSLGFFPGVFLLVMGGLAYTVGAILYGIGKKKSPWYHTVFHFFVLLGTSLMFFSLYFYQA